MSFVNKFGESDDCICGLVFYPQLDLVLPQNGHHSSNDAVPVPLKKVNVAAKIVDFVSEITVTQSYINVEDNPIEVTYMFPGTR